MQPKISNMPQRFLRPGIRTSERWNAVSRDAQALYIAIITLVDDYGRYDGRSAVLWADAFAVWNELNPKHVVNCLRIPALSCELSAKGLVEFYEFEGKKFLQVTQWKERARGESRYPDPKKGKILRNPAESCVILPPESESQPSPSPFAHQGEGIYEIEEKGIKPEDSKAEFIYQSYPRKVSKQDALKKIKSAIKEHGFEFIKERALAFAEAWKDETDLTYCPYPATWFNKKRFMEEPSTWRSGASSGVQEPLTDEEILREAMR